MYQQSNGHHSSMVEIETDCPYSQGGIGYEKNVRNSHKHTQNVQSGLSPILEEL